MAELFTVDIHTHILPEHIPDFGSRFGYRGSSTWTITRRVARG